MMVIVCSTDTLFVETLADLPLLEDDVMQVSPMDELGTAAQDASALILIDLKGCDEAKIPTLTQPAVALAEVPDYDQGMRLLRLGIRGYGNRHMHRDNLVQMVAAVKGGQVWLPPDFVSRMISTLSPEDTGIIMPQPMEPLSRREEEVARFVAEGLPNRDIAEKMHISVRTVKAHLTAIFAKTGYHDRLELAVKMTRG